MGVLSLYDITSAQLYVELAGHFKPKPYRRTRGHLSSIPNDYCTSWNDHTVAPYNDIIAFAIVDIYVAIYH